MKSKISKYIGFIIIVLSSIVIGITLYIKYKFGNAQAEQLIYSLLFAEGTSNTVILNATLFLIPIVIIGVFCMFFLTNTRIKKTTYFIIITKRKNKLIPIFPIKRHLLFSCVIFLLSLIFCFYSTGFFQYIKNGNLNSTIFENYYVDPKTTKITFPEKKQNLIYIYVESLESTYESVKISNKNYNLIPKLKKLAENNINFSNDSDFGGFQYIYGTDWTIAAIVAQTSGIPLKLVIDGNSYTGYDSFLPGVTSLGDILKDAGYKQYYMIGSDSEFGGRNSYFKTHGDFEIMDWYWAKSEEKIPSDYMVNWGFEDSKLFEYSKEKLLDISKNNEPFNFTILTANTHVPDGLTESSCSKDFNYKYANSIKCADDMISSFIEWVMRQSFFKNTTIIIVGDHLTMQGDIVKHVNEEERYIYNTIINSRITTDNTNNRVYTSFDMFPTTLASLGVNISGNRLGLGTNLFSNEKTLIEEMGFNELNIELSKNSSYYNYVFLQDTYYDMLKQ